MATDWANLARDFSSKLLEFVKVDKTENTKRLGITEMANVDRAAIAARQWDAVLSGRFGGRQSSSFDFSSLVVPGLILVGGAMLLRSLGGRR